MGISLTFPSMQSEESFVVIDSSIELEAMIYLGGANQSRVP